MTDRQKLIKHVNRYYPLLPIAFDQKAIDERLFDCRNALERQAFLKQLYDFITKWIDKPRERLSIFMHYAYCYRGIQEPTSGENQDPVTVLYTQREYVSDLLQREKTE